MHDAYCCSALYLVWRLMHPLGRMTHVRVHKELGSEPTSENEERAYQIKSSFVLIQNTIEMKNPRCNIELGIDKIRIDIRKCDSHNGEKIPTLENAGRHSYFLDQSSENREQMSYQRKRIHHNSSQQRLGGCRKTLVTSEPIERRSNQEGYHVETYRIR